MRGAIANPAATNKQGEPIEQVFTASRQPYGSYRVYKKLQAMGGCISHKRVARLMRQRGLRSMRDKRRRFGLTKAAQNRFVMPNLLKQDFEATRIQEKWVADTTYIPTYQGWLYLVKVLDLCSRMIVGWAMGQAHDAALATSALQMAIQRYRPKPGLIIHSDRGSEFTNQLWHRVASEAQMHISMSSTGNCFDNAPAESAFATIKLEAVHPYVFNTKREAQAALFDYIEVFYHRQRLHSSLGFQAPIALMNSVSPTPLNWV
jgi:putative transposase